MRSFAVLVGLAVGCAAISVGPCQAEELSDADLSEIHGGVSFQLLHHNAIIRFERISGTKGRPASVELGMATGWADGSLTGAPTHIAVSAGGHETVKASIQNIK